MGMVKVIVIVIVLAMGMGMVLAMGMGMVLAMVIPLRVCSRSNHCRILDSDSMMEFILFLETTEDGDGIF